MHKVIFGNYEFELIPGGYSSNSESVKLDIFANDLDLRDVESVITDINNVKRIEIRNEKDKLIQVFVGCTVVGKLEKVFDYNYNTYVNDEGSAIEQKTDMIICVMQKPGLKEQTEKNTADIEYIAIMEDIIL